MKTPEGLPGIDDGSFTLESIWKPTPGEELKSFVGEPKEPMLTIDLNSGRPIVPNATMHIVVKREHNIIHHFLGQQWFSTSIPGLKDEELDESRWVALAAPMTGVSAALKEHWKCSFCDKVNERDVDTCECGKDHGLCPIDGSYICEHGSEHDEWV